MKIRVSVTEFVRNFAEYVNRVAYAGERFVLVRGRRELAEVGPAPRGGRLAELESVLQALPRLEPEDAADFGRDVEEARRSLLPPDDAWGS